MSIIYVHMITFRNTVHSQIVIVNVIRHFRLPTGNALWFCQNLFFYFFFLFFRRQGFRMIIFDRQAGSLQNFNRSHIMVIGRSVSFSDPAWPQNPPPPPPEKLHAFQNPRNIFEKNILVGKKNSEIIPPPPPIFFFFFCVLRPQEHFLAKKKISVKNFTSPPPPPPPHMHAPAQSSEHSPQSSCNNK